MTKRARLSISRWFLTLLLALAALLPGATASAFGGPLDWSPKAPMPVAASRAASGVVNGRVYVLGVPSAQGSPGGPPSGVYAYDPATDNWSRTPDLGEPRFAGAVATAGSVVFIAGGYGPSGASSSVLAYDTSNGTTSVAGTLSGPRARMAGAFVAGRLYVVGGDGASGLLDTVEELDLGTGIARVVATLPEPIRLTSAAVVNGKIHICGGIGADGLARNTAFVFDPATGILSPAPFPMPWPASGWNFAVVGGRIYILGGITDMLASPFPIIPAVQELDPQTGTWRMAGDLRTPRFASMPGVVDGTLYLVGGDVGGADTAVNEAAFLIDVPPPGVWVPKAPMPLPVGWASSAATDNGVIYVLGGDPWNSTGGISPGTPAVQKYDPALDAWDDTLAPLPVPLGGSAAAALGDVIYVAGGHGSGSPFAIFDNVFAYDTRTGLTRSVGNMTMPRQWAEAAILGGRMYVAGGWNYDNVYRPVDTLERIDLATGASTAIQLPRPTGAAAVVAVETPIPPFAMTPRLFIMGGYGQDGAITGDCMTFDPASGRIDPIAPMPYNAATKAAGVLNGKIYVIVTHYAYPPPPQPYPAYNAVLAYDIATDTWAEVARTMTYRDGAEAKLVDGVLYVMGGQGPNGPAPCEALGIATAPDWTLYSVYMANNALIDWPAARHGVLAPGNYLRIAGTYHYVVSSWTPSPGNGDGYVAAVLQQCDQSTGAPLSDAWGNPLYSNLYGMQGRKLTLFAAWPYPPPADPYPPVTSASFSGIPGNGGWYVSPVQVTLSASDPDGSPIAYTEYDLQDGGGWRPYFAPFTIAGEGRTTFLFRSADNVHVESPARAATLDIDTTGASTSPAVSCDAWPAPWSATSWCRSVATVTLAAADSLSGPAGTEYGFAGSAGPWSTYAGPFTVSAEGETDVYHRSTDVAGNVGSAGRTPVRIDRTPPAVEIRFEGTAGTNDWYISPVRVEIRASDAGSGVGSVEYSFDNATWHGYAAPFTVSDGVRTIHARARDLANNPASAIRTVQVDAPDAPSGWTTSGPYGGGILATAISPQFEGDRTLFAAGYGGVFKSADGGASWAVVNSGLGNSTVESLAISPSYTADRTIFAGTAADGLFRSTDGGVTWTAANGGFPLYPYNPYYFGVNRIAVSPDFGSDRTVFAGTDENGGVYKSVDGGANWQLLPIPAEINMRIESLAVSPNYRNDRTVFVGTYGRGIIKSTDGGANWATANAGIADLNIMGLAVGPDYGSDPTVYALGQNGDVSRTIDGGASWTKVLAGARGTFGISPGYSADRTVFAGRYRSSDAGATWTDITPGLPGPDVIGSAVPGIGAYSLSPGYANDRTVFAGASGGAGLVKSVDGGATWTPSNEGIANGVTNALAASPDFVSDRTAFAGTSRGVFKTTDGGATWRPANAGLRNTTIQLLALSPQYPADTTVFAVAYNNYVYKSTDGGASWVQAWLTSEDIRTLVVSPNFGSDNTLFVGTIQIPNGTTTIYRSSNGGLNWTRVYQPPGSGYEIRSMAVSPAFASDRTVFASLQGKFLKSTAGGASGSWIEVPGVPAAFTTMVPSPAFASDRTIFGGSGSGGVLRSTDAGATWAPVGAGLPRNAGGYFYPVTSIALSPYFPSDRTLFAGFAGAGVYQSPDGGGAWTAVNAGLDGYLSVSSLLVPSYSPADPANRTVLAGTGRGGVWSYRRQVSRMPLSSIDSPLRGALLTDSVVTIRGTAADSAGAALQSVELSTDNGATWQRAVGTASWSLDWTPPADGGYTIASRAIDAAGNVGPASAGIQVSVDRTAPVSAIASPISGAFVGGSTLAIFGTASDGAGAGVARVDVSGDNGATWNPAVLDNVAGRWTFVWTVPGDGPVTIRSRALDRAGLLEAPGPGVTVRVDKAAPASVVTRPASGGYLKREAMTIAGTASDGSGSGVSKVEVSINNGPWLLATGNDAWSCAWVPAADNVYTIRSRATDALGNTEVPVAAPVTVTVDGTPPAFVSSIPMSQATNVSLGAVITVTYSENIQAASLAGAITVVNTSVKAKPRLPFTVKAVNRQLVITPAAPGLPKGSTIEVTVPAGAATDPAGNPSGAVAPFRFVTVKR